MGNIGHYDLHRRVTYFLARIESALNTYVMYKQISPFFVYKNSIYDYISVFVYMLLTHTHTLWSIKYNKLTLKLFNV